MKENPWICTVIAQLFLFIAAYITFNIGEPQKPSRGIISSEGTGRPSNMYFIIVAGGIRSFEEQARLIEQMAKVAETFKACFVVDISKFGGSDPLLHNATMHPKLRKIPWYTTGAFGNLVEKYSVEKIEVTRGQTVDIFTLDTTLFKDMGSVHANDQVLELRRILSESESNWKIVVGYHEATSCDHNIQKIENENETMFRTLPDILLPYEVDAFIGLETCAHGGSTRLLVTDATNRDAYTSTTNQKFVFKEESMDGFLLHQISSLDMATFIVELNGEMKHMISFQQRGRAVM